MENKPYKNYARPAAPTPAAKVEEPVEKSVAANAPEETPSLVPDTEEQISVEDVIKEESKANKAPSKSVERVNNIAETVNVKVVNVISLNVRSTPDYDAPNVVDQLKKGTRVNVTKEVGEFSEIGPNRYVMTKYLV